MPEFPGLQLLLGGYLNLDWPDDYGDDPWAAVDDFAASEPNTAAMLPTEIEHVLAHYSSDEEVRDLLVVELGCGYAVEADGLSYRDWLGQVAQRVLRSESSAND